MGTHHALKTWGCACLALALAACAGARRTAPDAAPAGARMGVYRALVELPSGEANRFRLLLYAEPPDRIHGEVLSAVGTTELILDGGGGRVAVTVPRQRVAYVGAADASALERVLGLRLTLEQLVGGLLGTHSDPAGHRWSREPRGQVGLPESLEVEGNGHRLALRLKRTRPLRASTASLGTGAAPDGIEIRPLEALEEVEFPDDPAAGAVP